MFESFFAKFAQVIPRVKADDEEIEDPQQILRRNKPLHEVRTQEKPKPVKENSNSKNNKKETPVPVNNNKEIPVNINKETPEKPAVNAVENVVNVDTKTTKSVACKTHGGGDDDEGKGKDKDKGKGGENGNGKGSGGDSVELVDPIDKLREKCREHRHAVALAKKYETCNSRVLSKSQTSETCVEELFDLLHAIDHCVTEKLFSQLK